MCITGPPACQRHSPLTHIHIHTTTPHHSHPHPHPHHHIYATNDDDGQRWQGQCQRSTMTQRQRSNVCSQCCHAASIDNKASRTMGHEGGHREGRVEHHQRQRRWEGVRGSAITNTVSRARMRPPSLTAPHTCMPTCYMTEQWEGARRAATTNSVSQACTYPGPLTHCLSPRMPTHSIQHARPPFMHACRLVCTHLCMHDHACT